MMNLKQCEGGEILVRRMQLLEDAVASDADNPNFENSDVFMGFGEKKGGALISPALRSHVSMYLGKEAAIMKEQRKLRELKKSGGGKGAERQP